MDWVVAGDSPAESANLNIESKAFKLDRKTAGRAAHDHPIHSATTYSAIAPLILV